MEIKDILEQIAKPCYSGKKGYKNTEKLEAIKELLERENSPYTLIKQSDQAWIFGQKEMEYGKKILLVSSHSDFVREITKPSSEYIESDRYFRGTYDNLGTNAACVYEMINRKMPKNTYFAFTADEETGRCNGAGYALSYVRSKTGEDPLVVALDVTDEGYENDRLFTIEGLHAKSEKARVAIAKYILSSEGSEQSCEFVRLKKSDDNSFLPRGYSSKGTTVFDESVFYAKQNLESFSMCLPTDGEMHDNSGLYVKEPVMRGYCESLASVIYTLTKSHQEEIDEIKKTKDKCVLEARSLKEYKPKVPSVSYYGGYYYNQKNTTHKEEQCVGQMSLSDFGIDLGGKSGDNLTFDEEEDEIEYIYELMAEHAEGLYYYNDVDKFVSDFVDYYDIPNKERHIGWIREDLFYYYFETKEQDESYDDEGYDDYS